MRKNITTCDNNKGFSTNSSRVFKKDSIDENHWFGIIDHYETVAENNKAAQFVWKLTGDFILCYSDEFCLFTCHHVK